MVFNEIQPVVEAALAAGRAILAIYEQDESAWQVEQKADASPLTAADRAAHAVIVQQLQAVWPEVPILSEEGVHLPAAERKEWKQMWVVDPLDGTKEFLKRNGEFTVNIALVEEGTPVLGVVYAPVLRRLYVGLCSVEEGRSEAYCYDVSDKGALIETSRQALPFAQRAEGEPLRIVASKSHLNAETQIYINAVREKYGEVSLVSAGSSLKICLVATGEADLYPRLAPTMEWDTAAGHAVLLAAGGKMLNMEDEKGTELVYNKEDLHNPWFLATRMPKE